MYHDLTRHYVAYRRDGDIPAWLHSLRQEHLDVLNNIAKRLHLFIKIDFWVSTDGLLPYRHQSHIEIESLRDCFIVNTAGSNFYNGIQPISLWGEFRNPNLARLTQVIQKGFHHDDLSYILTGRTSDELERELVAY